MVKEVGPGFEFKLTAASFPTGLLDRVASREGLLADLFGDSLEQLSYETSELGAPGPRTVSSSLSTACQPWNLNLLKNHW